MCTTTSQTPQPRDINVLLALNTYQGMTDEEIELVITHRVTTRLSAELASATRQADAQTMATLMASLERVCASANAMVQFSLEQPAGTREVVLRSVTTGREETQDPATE